MSVSANIDEDGAPQGRDTTFGMREKMLKARGLYKLESGGCAKL
jgi:hypothetical protein